MTELLRFSRVMSAHWQTSWAAVRTERRERDVVRSATRWMLRVRAVPVIAEATAAFAGAFLIWLGVRSIAGGKIAGAEFLTFLTALFLLLPVVKRLGALAGDLKTAFSAAERLHARMGIDAVYHVHRPFARPVEISVNDLYVRAGGHTILRDVTFSVPAGKMLAVEGPTGAGKTVLLNTLAGLLLLDGGTITWNREIVSGPDGIDLPAPVGYVPQDTWAVEGTVAENVTLGRDIRDEEVRGALRLASLDVSPELAIGEGGSPLSGGERQRLALARALAGCPAVLILDEPTSALDARTSEKIVETLLSLAGEATVVVSSHDGTVLDAAGKVICLQNGGMQD